MRGRESLHFPRHFTSMFREKKRVEAIISFKNVLGQISLWCHKAEQDLCLVAVGRALLTGTILIHPAKKPIC